MWLRARKYLVSYWNGEYPVPRTLLAGGAIVLVTALGSEALSITITECFWANGLNALDVLIDLLSFHVPMLAALIFWSVGTWRASAALSRKLPAARWPYVSRAVICVALFFAFITYRYITLPEALDTYAEFVGDPQMGPRGVRLASDGGAVRIYGFLTLSIADEFSRALVANHRVRYVELEGKGGRTGAAIRIAHLIRARQLDTVVLTECLSACALAFLGGAHRLISPRAQLGFHAASFGGLVDSESNTRLRAEIVKEGVSPSFAAIAFNSRVMWYPSLRQLQVSHVVTGVLEK